MKSYFPTLKQFADQQQDQFEKKQKHYQLKIKSDVQEHERLQIEIAAVRAKYPHAYCTKNREGKRRYLMGISSKAWFSACKLGDDYEMLLIINPLKIKYQFNNQDYIVEINPDENIQLWNYDYWEKEITFSAQYKKLNPKLREKAEKLMMTFFRNNLEAKINRRFVPPNIQKLLNFT